MSDPKPSPRNRLDARSEASSGRNSGSTGDAYIITVKGTLDDAWSPWFDGMSVTHDSNGDTALVGNVRDQAALHGLLTKIRDLGLTLVSVEARPGTLGR